MNALIWTVAAAWIVVVLIVIRAAIGEHRFVKAQHRAYWQWDRTGQIIPGWSHHWRWSHPKDVEAPSGLTVVINQVFTTIVNVVNVTHVHVRALILPGYGGSRGSSQTSGTGSGPAQVITGQIARSLPDASVRPTDQFTGALTGSCRNGGGSR